MTDMTKSRLDTMVTIKDAKHVANSLRKSADTLDAEAKRLRAAADVLDRLDAGEIAFTFSDGRYGRRATA